MPRSLIKRWIPDTHNIGSYPGLRFLGSLRHDPNLFHLNRHSVSEAFFLGLFIAFLPIPGQVPLAAFGALLLRCNLPISMALVWVTNPFTFPFVFYGCYKLGVWILNIPHNPVSFSLSWEWLQNNFLPIWPPLVLGCLICALFFSCLGYLIIQWTWRWHITQKWNARKAHRKT